MIDYRNQIKFFWLAQEAYQLGTSEIALYFYLVEVSDKTGRTGTFYRNNHKIMIDLGIKSYKTFQSVRDKLRAAELLEYQQRNGAANVHYTLADLSKKYQGIYQGLVKGIGQGSVKGSGEGSGEVKTNVIQLVSVFKELRTDLTDETLKAEALKLLAKKPSATPVLDMPYITSWAQRITKPKDQNERKVVI